MRRGPGHRVRARTSAPSATARGRPRAASPAATAAGPARSRAASAGRELLLKRVLSTGIIGAIASAAAAALASRVENRHAARPINAIAHIYDGGMPPAHDGHGGRNTAVGLGIHTAASLWWAVFF